MIVDPKGMTPYLIVTIVSVVSVASILFLGSDIYIFYGKQLEGSGE